MKSCEDLFEEWEDTLISSLTIDKLCSCPIGSSYFFKFLQTEFNTENLQSTVDFQSLKSELLKENCDLVAVKVN